MFFQLTPEEADFLQRNGNAALASFEAVTSDLGV
jgi:hypothetical protein